MQQQVLSTKNESIRFDIKINQDLVNFLIRDGYLEEEEFDIDEYFDETDVYVSWGLGKPVSDAVIDFYDELIDEKEAKEYIKEEQYRDTDFLEASTLMKYLYIVDEDNLLDCVSVYDVTGKDKPYIYKRKKSDDWWFFAKKGKYLKKILRKEIYNL